MQLSECFKSAGRIFKSHAGTFVLMSLVLALAELALSLLLILALKETGVVLSYALTGAFWACYVAMALSTVRGTKPTLACAVAPIAQRPLSFLIVSVAIYSGLLGFGVGVFITATLFVFAPVCALEGSNAWQALSRSKDLVLAHPGEALLLCLVLTSLNFIGMLAFLVGWLVTMPFSALLIVKAYEFASSNSLQCRIGGCHA